MNSVQITEEPPLRHDSDGPSDLLDDEPTGAFARFGRFIADHARLVVAAFVIGLIIAGVFGSQMFSRLGSQGFQDPASESSQVAQALRDDFGVTDPVVVLAVGSESGVDDSATSAAAQALVADLATQAGVSDVVSYWTDGQPAQLRSEDGTLAQILVFSESIDAAEQSDIAAAITDDVTALEGDLEVYVGGFAVVGNALTETITEDLAKAESVAVPLTMLLLLIVFGSAVSAGLPMIVAAGAVIGSFFTVWLVTLTTDVSVFALNLITGLGLALGIDYALLVVNRFREELKAGHQTRSAVVRTVASAGRTVAVSGVAVAVVLASLMVFPLYFLQSFAYAGIAVTLLAVVSAITALPAMLMLLGPNVDRWRVRRRDLAPSDDGAWSRVARFVMRRPWPVLAVALTALIALTLPAFAASFGQVDSRALPADNPAAIASAVLTDEFAGQEASPVNIVIPAGEAAAIEEYAAQLSQLPGVVRVTTPTDVVVDSAVVAPNPDQVSFVSDETVRLSLIADIEPRTADGQALVEDVRAVESPTGDAMVGGSAAEFTDSQAAIVNALPAALLWVGLATLLVLFLYTGSVVLPVKAVALNVLSLGATLGALVLVFQEGYLGWLVGDFVNTGTVDTSTVVLIAVVAFALSMDYEVFLLSRIKEEHDAGADTTTAVALGLQRSGRIITAAALLIAVVFASFLSSGVTNIKQLGFGVAFAILLDATLVRGILVPAFMRLAGRLNWWAPAPLVTLHRRIGLSD